MSDYVVRKSVTLSATPSEVWDALTNPEKTKKYFFNCRVLSDFKPGSDITFKGRILLFKKIEMRGKILAADEGHVLKYKLLNGEGNGGTTESVVTDTINFDKGVTTLSITDDVGGGDEAEARYQRSQKGWDKVLKGLKKVVEDRD